jgi:hypothetical protein
MTQPSGCVCRLPARYRTFVRSSPLVCAADAFTMVLRLVVVSIALWVSPARSLRLLREARFPLAEEGDDINPDDDLARLVSMTWLRWIFFVVATLPMAVKLMVMTGVPWTQAFGTMFLVSFIAVELFVVVSARVKRNMTPAVILIQPKHWILDLMDVVELGLGILALFAQLAINIRPQFWIVNELISYMIASGTTKDSDLKGIACGTAFPFTIFLIVIILACLPDDMNFFKAVMCLLTTACTIILLYHFSRSIGYYMLQLCSVFALNMVLFTLTIGFSSLLPTSNISESSQCPGPAKSV